MKTHNTRRKKGFRCVFALVTVITLAVPYVALGAGAAFRSSGRISSSQRQRSFSHRFHRFGFFGGDGFDDFGGDGLDDQDAIIIQQVQPAPSTLEAPLLMKS
jgi:hypothetical protein